MGRCIEPPTEARLLNAVELVLDRLEAKPDESVALKLREQDALKEIESLLVEAELVDGID